MNFRRPWKFNILFIIFQDFIVYFANLLIIPEAVGILANQML